MISECSHRVLPAGDCSLQSSLERLPLAKLINPECTASSTTTSRVGEARSAYGIVKDLDDTPVSFVVACFKACTLRIRAFVEAQSLRRIHQQVLRREHPLDISIEKKSSRNGSVWGCGGYYRSACHCTVGILCRQGNITGYGSSRWLG
jgi:hypothetical protein